MKPYRPGDSWYTSVVKPDFWYQKITSVGPKKIWPSVSVVTIKEGPEPNEALGDNWCTARLFLARLLYRVSEAGPRMIAIDRWYRPNDASACSQGNATTEELAKAIGTVSKDIPIVIAMESVNYVEVAGYCSPQVTLPRDTLVLVQRVRFETGNKNVHYGLARFNESERRIPLGWLAYSDCNQAQLKTEKPKLIPTLALESLAVSQHEDVSEILKQTGLETEFTDIDHPFAHFRDEGFPEFSAMRILCGDSHDVDWRTCAVRGVEDLDLEKLRGQIVLIGELAPSDIFNTVIGPMPGVIIHANYIDSLMNSHFFKPVFGPLEVAVSIVWCCLIEMIFRWKASSPELALGLSLLTAAIMGFLFYSILVVYFGVYAILLPPSILAMVGRWITLRLG